MKLPTKLRFKTVDGFEDYVIYEDGTIRNIVTNNNLKPRLQKGYLRVTMCIEGKRHYKFIHQMLANAFIDNPYGHKVVRHLNDNRTDNRLSNLAWGSIGDNNQDKYDNGFLNPCRKLSCDEARKIFLSSHPHDYIASKYKVSRTVISNIKNRKTYRKATDGCRRII